MSDLNRIRLLLSDPLLTHSDVDLFTADQVSPGRPEVTNSQPLDDDDEFGPFLDFDAVGTWTDGGELIADARQVPGGALLIAGRNRVSNHEEAPDIECHVVVRL